MIPALIMLAVFVVACIGAYLAYRAELRNPDPDDWYPDNPRRPTRVADYAGDER